MQRQICRRPRQRPQNADVAIDEALDGTGVEEIGIELHRHIQRRRRPPAMSCVRSRMACGCGRRGRVNVRSPAAMVERLEVLVDEHRVEQRIAGHVPLAADLLDQELVRIPGVVLCLERVLLQLVEELAQRLRRRRPCLSGQWC